jgi:hypothetical protein
MLNELCIEEIKNDKFENVSLFLFQKKSWLPILRNLIRYEAKNPLLREKADEKLKDIADLVMRIDAKL